MDKFISHISALANKAVAYISCSRYAKVAIALTLILTTVASVSVYSAMCVYNVEVDGVEIACVKDVEAVKGIVARLEAECSEKMGEDVSVGNEISFDRTISPNMPMTSDAELENRLSRSLDFVVPAYAVMIDGEPYVYVESEEEAKVVVDSALLYGLAERNEGSVTALKPEESVEIEAVGAKREDIATQVDALKLLCSGKKIKDVHICSAKDNAYSVALRYGMSIDRLVELNPNMKEIYRVGDKLDVERTVPVITAVSTEVLDEVEDCEFEIEMVDDSQLHQGQIRIQTPGRKGRVAVKTEVVRKNGEYAYSSRLDERILVEPVKQVVLRGVKDRPPTVALGSFILPTTGEMTSPYGMRDGRMHRGIDIANEYFTPIFAADGGVVSFAGWNAGYGNIIEIDHENGYKTRYAHLAQMDVDQGDRVSQGDVIAYMGSTGYSTGVHLHFEVLLEGIHQNPYYYVYED